MELASIINQYYDSFMAKHSDTLLPGHLKALNAIRRCRTPDSGECLSLCYQCGLSQWNPMSCGHRSCPKCQNHETSRWIDRQQDKLLPSPYFMVTFTLPYSFRPLVFYHQKEIYPFLFSCAASTLSDFALNPKNLGAKVGMSIVLHTHNRKLDYHPHVHVLIPGGGVEESHLYETSHFFKGLLYGRRTSSPSSYLPSLANLLIFSQKYIFPLYSHRARPTTG
ncbi:MAG: transposase zinc-binding domain-containing protein [Deltaproteobacteria bacterium]|nr:transposase zinc-binding domain-containing protein [Deltaproteobacteria bacterium]